MSVELRTVKDFDEVRFKGPGILKITQSDEVESLTIHAPAYVISDIQSDVRDGVLFLGYVAPKVVSLKVIKEVISYDLRVNELRALSLSGSGRILIPDFDNDRLKARLSGSGHIVLDHLTADHLDAQISGSGKISVAGDIERQDVLISGSGVYDAQRLVSDFCYLTVPGSGLANVSVTDYLDVKIAGSGQVNYLGFPEVNKRITGSGRVKRLRKQDRGQNPSGEDHG